MAYYFLFPEIDATIYSHPDRFKMNTGHDEILEIVKEKGLEQVSDDNEILKLVEAVISDNQEKVKEFLSGKDKLFGFFVGQVMKVSRGKANPGIVNKLLKEHLK